MSLPRAGAKALDLEDVPGPHHRVCGFTTKNSAEATQEDSPKKEFGTALNFTRWSDLDDKDDEEMTLAHFGLHEKVNAVNVNSGLSTYPKEVNSHEFENRPVYTLDDMSPTFYVHRTHVFQCSPAAFSNDLFACM